MREGTDAIRACDMAAPLLLRLVFALAGVCASPQLPAAEDPKQTKETFAVEHSLRVTDIPSGSESVRIWFWMPDDDEAQKILDLAVTEAPAGFQIIRDPTYGSIYLDGEIKNPGASARISTRFTFARHEIGGGIDPLKAGPLTESQRATFAEHLRCDCPNMEVSNRIVDLADEICATETNVVKQARLIYDYVIDHSNHVCGRSIVFLEVLVIVPVSISCSFSFFNG